MEDTRKKPAGRNSAVEGLRILAVLMIVLSHICVHSGFDYTYSRMTVNRLFIQFGVLGNLGVVIFVLISGYFQYGRDFRSRAVTKLLSQVWTTSVIVYLVCKFGYGYYYTPEATWAVFLPVIFNEYWFATVFVILLLLGPYLNRLVDGISRNQFETLIGVMGTLWVVIPTLSKQYLYAAEVEQFVLFYFLGAYLRKYPDNLLMRKPWLRWALAVGGFALLYGLTVYFGYQERVTEAAFGASARFYNRNSLVIVAIAVGLFSIAAYWKPFTNRIINGVASCAFGVYLIHDNPAVRKILWREEFCYVKYHTDSMLIPRMIVTVLGVYVACTILEWLRLKLLDKPMSALFHKVLGPAFDRIPGKMEDAG